MSPMTLGRQSSSSTPAPVGTLHEPMERTYYDVLGVGPDATAEELATARERRNRVLGAGARLRPAPEHEAVAAALLQQLDQAFSILDDDESRQAYDVALETGAPVDAALLEEVDARFQEQYASTVERIGGRIEAYVQALAPGTPWAREDACAPWDVVLETRDGDVTRTVSVKVLADLHPGDLVGTIESAEAQLAQGASDRPQTHAFFLVAGLLLESSRLFTLAEEFNRASWVERDPGGARAFLAFADLDGHLPTIPAVEDPAPDLAQVCAAIDPADLPDELRPPGVSRAPAPPPPAPPPASSPPAPAPPAVDSHVRGRRAPPPPPPVPGVLAATSGLVAEAGAVTATSPGRERPPSNPGEVFTVLVVDDERLPYQMVKRALTDLPFDLHHTQTWVDSRTFLNEAECAVLLLDLNMPTISGDKLAMYVHSHPEIQPKPRIVIHSGLPLDELRRVAARIGAHACLQKGCGPEAIREAVRAAARAYTRDQLLTGPW